jgi:hypothetical protein
MEGGGGEKMDSHRKVLKMFSPLKILNSPFSKETFGAFLPFSFLMLPFLSSYFFLCSVCLLRTNSGSF